jgi:pilus assembly protein CpaE
MEHTPQILVIGSDPLLADEFAAAVAGLRMWKPVVHTLRGTRQGVEVARNRRPEIVCVQVESDPRALRTFAEEVVAASPGTAVVALYRPDSPGFAEGENTLLIEAVRAQVQDFLRRPLSSNELQQLLDRVLRKAKETPREFGRIVSFVSNKGGVGKSTMSVSVACDMASRLPPGRVLLVDCSVHLGSCGPMLDLTPTTTLAHAAREQSRLDETLLRKLTVRHECGLDLLGAPVDPVDASVVDEEALSRTLTLARRTYDWVIVDTFPMLDGMIMSILDLSDRAYVVVQNTVPNVVGAARLLPVIRQIGFPAERTRIVLNNNFEKAPGGLKVEDVEDRLEAEVDYVIPYQKRLITALNTGRPYILHAPKWYGFGKAVHRLVEDLLTGDTLPAEAAERAAAKRAPAPAQPPQAKASVAE